MSTNSCIGASVYRHVCWRVALVGRWSGLQLQSFIRASDGGRNRNLAPRLFTKSNPGQIATLKTAGQAIELPRQASEPCVRSRCQHLKLGVDVLFGLRQFTRTWSHIPLAAPVSFTCICIHTYICIIYIYIHVHSVPQIYLKN